MKKFLFGLLSTISFFTHAGVCEVPKKSINIHGLSLDRPIAQIKSEHPNTFQFNLDGTQASIGFIDQHDFKDFFNGTPVSAASYVSFNKKTKLVNGFSVLFDKFNNFNAQRYKNALVTLYGLPSKNWKYSKLGNEYEQFAYSCDEYSIEIVHSEERGSFMLVESKKS